MNKVPASVGILEDDDVFRAYLAEMIQNAPAFHLAFAASTLTEAKAAASLNADICLVDLKLPEGSGLEFTRHLKSHWNTKVLVLTVLGDRKSVLAALECGADGYLLKDTPPDQVLRDLECVLGGETPISPAAATHLLQSFLNTAQRSGLAENQVLTPREHDTLRLFERGLSYQEAAETLGVSRNTIRTHVKSIYAKLNVSSKSEAVFEAQQLGWLRN